MEAKRSQARAGVGARRIVRVYRAMKMKKSTSRNFRCLAFITVGFVWRFPDGGGTLMNFSWLFLVGLVGCECALVALFLRWSAWSGCWESTALFKRRAFAVDGADNSALPGGIAVLPVSLPFDLAQAPVTGCVWLGASGAESFLPIHGLWGCWPVSTDLCAALADIPLCVLSSSGRRRSALVWCS